MNHVYARLKGIDCDDDDLDLTTAERAEVSIMDNRLHEHRQLALHYTTYDLRRKKETISPTISTSDIMLLSREADKLSKEQHPFWYCRVIRMFHVDARLRSIPDSEMKRIDILWVRWFGRDADSAAGDETCRLERLRFVSKDDNSPLFSFVDPDLVVHAIHLVPAFRFGRTEDLLPPSSLARVKQASDNCSDWESFYVNKLSFPSLFESQGYRLAILDLRIVICSCIIVGEGSDIRQVIVLRVKAVNPSISTKSSVGEILFQVTRIT